MPDLPATISEVIFRNCLRSDLCAVQLLVDQLYEDDQDSSQLKSGTTTRQTAHPDVALTFSELEQKPDKGRIVIFELEGRPVGYAILIYFWSNEFRGDVIEIDELLVERSMRGSGIGDRFFQWLDDQFSDSCVGFSLQVSNANIRAVSLYERAGFVCSPNKHLLKLL